MEGLNSNLNLNGSASARVRPKLGDWAPQNVPMTRHKRRQRWWAVLMTVLVVAAVVGFGYYAYLGLRGF